ncbi:Swt1 family HEPN domain-containing protein [Hymenobacter glacialis]|uniref:Uncharacterized protein n=1 Tax=Hymenobacter glacialis TaxID=1908236 RepID=A0A1G1SYU1_9BACT|nr:Swt1 family HEPN domain-containing protein [Hymenobacter glacialis]OGX83792.1 hypothetical protein BEN48_03230 [Hymenobacter glacialis]
MNEKQALQDVENVLRDFLSATLEKKFGTSWFYQCGLPEERINKWKEKFEAELRKQRYSNCDPRLIYYSDFYDLGNIIRKNWELFVNAFGEKKEIEIFLKLLEDFRNTNAHGRELLTYQKHIVVGLTGEIRNRITKFRSMQETGESYFPRIESVHDNYGNSWKMGDLGIITGLTLREGDILEFVVSATDPKDERIEYSIDYRDWQSEKHIQVLLSEAHIRQQLTICILIRSQRSYHASDGYDDAVIFKYQVLPKLA